MADADPQATGRTPGSPKLRQAIENAQLYALEARTTYQQARTRGGVTDAVVNDLRDAMLRLYEALKRYRDKHTIKDDWRAAQFDRIDRWLSDTRPVQKQNPERPNSYKTEQVPVIQAVNPQQLAEITEKLEELAGDLGFAPKYNDKTPKEIGSVEDIKWLLKARGQEVALEDLDPPEQPRELVSDGGAIATSGDSATLSAAQPTTAETVSRYPFRGPFFQDIAKRKKQNKDAKITVSSGNAETGVGKSTCAYYLAHTLDTSTSGFNTDEKATLTLGRFLQLYDELPKGSSLILDEAEQIDARRSMKEENIQAGRKWETRRINEIVALLTLPAFSELDKRLRKLVDYRVEVERRGLATIYKKQHSRWDGDIWWDVIQQLEFPAMDFAPGMQQLDSLKDQFIDGASADENYVPESEVGKQVEEAAEQAEQKGRYKEWCRQHANGATFTDIAERTDYSAEWVRQVWHEHHEKFGFEEPDE